MSNDKTEPFLSRMKQGATGAVLAGALAAGGCSSQSSAPMSNPQTEAQAPVPVLPDAFGDMPMDRVAVSLVVNDERVLISPTQGRDYRQLLTDAQNRINRLVEHPEGVTRIGIEFVDRAGRVGPCLQPFELAPQGRTRENILLQLHDLQSPVAAAYFANACDLDNLERYQDEVNAIAPGTFPQRAPEPVDPRTIAADGRSLDGRIERDGVKLGA